MKKYLPLILLIGLHLFFVINLRFTAWPEMLSYPYLRNQGYLLYKDIIHPYPPVLTMALSLVYHVFGYKLIVLKVVTWLIILANDILIFLIAKKLTKSVKYSFLSLTSYILLQPFLEGNQLWFDLAIVPSILLGALFLINKKYFLAGTAIAVALLTKQTAGVFLIFTFLYLIIRKSKIKDLISFLAGPIILCLTLVLRLITENALLGFLNWTLIYPFTYWSKFPGYVQMALTNRQLLILVLLLIPTIPVLLNRKYLLLTFYFILSVVLVYPRFSFLHFQLGLALIAIFLGVLAKDAKAKVLHLTSYFLLLFSVVSLPVLKIDWQKETRFWGEQDIKLAKIIKDSTKPSDKIFLLGPHSGLYVLADRLPPKIWSDNFGWYLEIPGVQEEIIAGWEKDPPKYVFTSEPQSGNWYDLGTYRPKVVSDWIDKERINRLVLSE